MTNLAQRLGCVAHGHDWEKRFDTEKRVETKICRRCDASTVAAIDMDVSPGMMSSDGASQARGVMG